VMRRKVDVPRGDRSWRTRSRRLHAVAEVASASSMQQALAWKLSRSGLSERLMMTRRGFYVGARCVPKHVQAGREVMSTV